MSRVTRCDLVFAPDPFKSGGTPRPWLVISDSAMPFPGDLLAVACTRSDYLDNHVVTPADFDSGSMPDQTTYCSPWLLATLKTTAVAHKQGTLTKSFTDMIARQADGYVDTG